ncbi:ImpA family type VI secretion system protein [Sphingomonas sp.]|uniref:type VI secretion system protein TssA n=1 Tax=Sphingomonas sp. TaxID=28214 RepID=UPI003CC590A4
MAIDITALVTPLSFEDGAQAGPDLSYSNERSAIEAPFQLDANGDTVEERAWRDSIKLIVAQAAETRDLWLATYLARAGAKVGELDTVVDGTAMLAALMEGLWDEVHPTLEEADYIGRKTPCESFTKIREFLNPLRRTTLFEHRMGKVTGEDLERFASAGPAAEGFAQFRGAIETDDADRAAEIKASFAAAVEKLDAIRDSLKRVDNVLVAHAGSDTGTNFDPTYEAIASIRAAAVPFAGLEPEPQADEFGYDVGGGGGAALSGAVHTRNDVIRAIDAIVGYYATREPASPVPVLLKRARHWVEMDFMELLDDLVPDSVAAAKTILVSKRDEQTGNGGGGSDNGYSTY